MSARHHPIVWPSQLFAKAIIQSSSYRSAEGVHAYVVHQNERSLYIISVLAAPAEIRAEVMAEAIANVAADPENIELDGQKQLVCILTSFELMTAQEKLDFIRSFKANVVIAGHGMIEVVNRNTYQPGHIPPQYPP